MIKLTIEEKHCIRQHLKFYQDLDSGRRRPTTRAQHRFVQVCRGRMEPETMHEHAYLKWKEIQEGGEQ